LLYVFVFRFPVTFEGCCTIGMIIVQIVDLNQQLDNLSKPFGCIQGILLYIIQLGQAFKVESLMVYSVSV